MEDRRERRALPARRHVGGAKIPDDRDAEAIGERLPVADLHGQRPRRIVEHGLAVEADEVDVAALDAARSRGTSPPPRRGGA